MTTLLVTGRLVLSGVFLWAALAKLLDRAGSRQAMVDFGFPASWSLGLALGLPWIEMAVAAGLLFVASAWWASAAALTLLVLFTAAIGLNLARGRRPACHCFGQAHSRPIGLGTLARNGALVLIALFLVGRGYREPAASIANWLALPSATLALAWAASLVALLLLGAVVWLLLEILKQQGRILVRLDALEVGGGAPAPRPEPPVAVAAVPPAQGLPVGAAAPAFELTDLAGQGIDGSTLLGTGQPVLFFFMDPQCGPCTALLPEIEEWHVRHGEAVTFVIVSRGSSADNEAKGDAHRLPRILLQKDFEVAQAFQIHGTPSAVLVAADGTLASRAVSGADAIRGLVAAASGAAARPAPPPTPLPAGAAVPDMELRSIAGEPFQLQRVLSQRSAVVFWNPSCGFCQQMLGDLQAWEARADGAQRLVMISQGTREENDAMGLRSMVLLDTGFAAGRAFGTTGTPTALLVDDEGHIASELAVGREAVMKLLEARPEAAAAEMVG